MIANGQLVAPQMHLLHYATLFRARPLCALPMGFILCTFRNSLFYEAVAGGDSHVCSSKKVLGFYRFRNRPIRKIVWFSLFVCIFYRIWSWIKFILYVTFMNLIIERDCCWDKALHNFISMRNVLRNRFERPSIMVNLWGFGYLFSDRNFMETPHHV